MDHSFAVVFGVWGGIVLFMCGVLVGAWLRDNVWRAKANGPSRMLSGGRFYQVLTSEAYDDLLRNYR